MKMVCARARVRAIMNKFDAVFNQFECVIAPMQWPCVFVVRTLYSCDDLEHNYKLTDMKKCVYINSYILTFHNFHIFFRYGLEVHCHVTNAIDAHRNTF